MWTKEDRKQLEELQDRKTKFETSLRQPLIDFVVGIPANSKRSEIADYLIAHADKLRDLLAPFDSRTNPAEPNGDGWIKWHGGECPVDECVRVEVKTRGDNPATTFATNMRWYWIDSAGDIVAYRVISE